MSASDDWLRSRIRAVPDFPEPGVLFRDLSPLLADVNAFRLSVESLADEFLGCDVSHVVGIDARGFIFGAAVAARLGVGFVPVRKAGKLPPPVLGVDYDLEYGSSRLELNSETLGPDSRVVIIDDVLATGGTVAATIELLKSVGAEIIGAGFVVELAGLKGRGRMRDVTAHVLVTYD